MTVVKVSTSEEERSARLIVEERLRVCWLDVGFDVEDSLLCEPASFVNLEI